MRSNTSLKLVYDLLVSNPEGFFPLEIAAQLKLTIRQIRTIIYSLRTRHNFPIRMVDGKYILLQKDSFFPVPEQSRKTGSAKKIFLNELLSAGDAGVTTDDLHKAANVKRSAVSAHISFTRKLGYKIECIDGRYFLREKVPIPGNEPEPIQKSETGPIQKSETEPIQKSESVPIPKRVTIVNKISIPNEVFTINFPNTEVALEIIPPKLRDEFQDVIAKIKKFNLLVATLNQVIGKEFSK